MRIVLARAFEGFSGTMIPKRCRASTTLQREEKPAPGLGDP